MASPFYCPKRLVLSSERKGHGGLKKTRGQFLRGTHWTVCSGEAPRDLFVLFGTSAYRGDPSDVCCLCG